MKKRLNKKGFTLIELLAVIVVLAIILVITVPMVLNSISSTRQDALQASANSVAKFYEEQLGLKALGKAEDNFATDAVFDDDGKLTAQSNRCITLQEKSILDLSNDYIISDTTDNNCSTVSWDANGKVKVTLNGANDGKFEGRTATSNN